MILYLAVNPHATDCLIDTFEDPAQKVFFGLLFSLCFDMVQLLDSSDLANFLRLPEEVVTRALKEFSKKELIFCGSSRKEVYEILDLDLEPLTKFSPTLDGFLSLRPTNLNQEG